VVDPHNADVGHDPVNAGGVGGDGRHLAEPRQRGFLSRALGHESKLSGE
jgi:hypothetical protein